VADGVRVNVRGLKELSRDFRRISKGLSDDLVDSLKEAAEVVERDAEDFALGRIRNMPSSPRWSGMRIGVSRAQGLVYIVPSARSRRRAGSSRGNLANLLRERAMDPAVERNASSVEKKVDDLLGRLAGQSGF
jgi:hypothetical protein